MYDDLSHNFAEEASLSQQCLYFARVAEIEGHAKIARMFRDLADAGVCSSHGHLDFLRELGDPEIPIGDTEQNIRSAIDRMTQAYTVSYPQMADRARSSGLEDVASWYDNLTRAKEFQAVKMQKLLESTFSPKMRPLHEALEEGGQ